MQAPVGVAPAPAKLVTVAPAAVDASEAVTSEHASTFEIRVELGEGEWLADEDDAEGELDDPQAAINKPATATSANAAVCPIGECLAGFNLVSIVPQGYCCQTARPIRIAIRR
jgi:hypothetical protein